MKCGHAKEKGMSFLQHLGGKQRKIILALFDLLCFMAVDTLFYVLANNLEHSIPVHEIEIYLLNTLFLGVGIFGFRMLFGVYRTVWRYTSTKAYFSMVLADFCGGIIAMLAAYPISSYRGIWHFLTVASLTALTSLMARFCYRLLYKSRQSRACVKAKKSTAIVGAGQLGTFLAHDLQNNPNSDYDPLFFIDRDKGKIGNTVAGLRVVSESDAVLYIRDNDITDIIIAIANIDSERAAYLYQFYTERGCRVKIYDSLTHEIPGKNDGSRVIRDVVIEDLLFRKPRELNDQKVLDFYAGKTVLVTGGGGSIGSEICRQIAHCGPKRLLIVDIYENNAYEIQQELWHTYGDRLDLEVEIASVRDRDRMESIFCTYRPDVVFHAAAHKHVPLMERSACETVKNNIFGTYNAADMAEKYGVEKFILISTDKAVNPTNVMGASKRMCEMIVQSRTDSQTSFAAVRFGNVLGSNGSVIPLFKKQIAAGGPVTVTDKRIIRYFMTIQEASQLVIQAGAMAKRGELFVLDMGKPVRIYDLAENMIRLSGLEPNVDIRIEEIGLRPGEKLYEELLIKTEHQEKTENNLIFIEHDTALSREEVARRIRILADASQQGNADEVRAAFSHVVPTYCDSGLVNSKADQASEMQMV